MSTLTPSEALQLAVHHKVSELKSKWPCYNPQGCACGLWTDSPWLYLLVSNPKRLSEEGKKERDRVVMEWAEHMEGCKKI